MSQARRRRDAGRCNWLKTKKEKARAMKSIRTLWAVALMSILTLGAGNTAVAADLTATYWIESSENSGEVIEGTLTITVFNLTGGDLKNVNLRLELGGMNAIVGQVIQFGRVPAGAGRVARARFRLDQVLFDEVGALPWRADFDDALGNQYSAVVIAARSQ